MKEITIADLSIPVLSHPRLIGQAILLWGNMLSRSRVTTPDAAPRQP